MSKPKITGLVNNCSMNCALPILMKGFGTLATLEAQGLLSTVRENPIVNSYYRLKDIFAGFYGFDRHPAFDWHVFNAFLNAQSFYARELMFAPIFRVFIGQQRELIGVDDQIIEPPSFFADMQEDGRYNMISGDVASRLFYQPFGINVEIISEGSAYTTKLVSPHQNYPFGQSPHFNIYLNGAHFEIQPHHTEEMKAATREFEQEIQCLPPGLQEIHDLFSTSITMHDSDVALSKMVPMVFELLMKFLPKRGDVLHCPEGNAEEQAVKEDITLSHLPLSNDAPPIEPGPAMSQESDRVGVIRPQELKLPSLAKDHVLLDGATYALNAEKYAEIGKKIHSDTPSGRQTFAMILLSIDQDEEHHQKKSQQLIQYIRTLAQATASNKPLAAYLLDSLNQAIIKSKARLDAPHIDKVVEEIHLHLSYLDNISFMRPVAKYEKLIKASEQTIEQAWLYYKKTNNEDYLTVIQLTENITSAKKPSQQLLDEYKTFSKKLDGQGSLGKKIAGMMSIVLGLVLIVTAATTETVSLGIATPISIAVIAAGVGLFKWGMDSGMYKETKRVDDEVRQLFSQGL